MNDIREQSQRLYFPLALLVNITLFPFFDAKAGNRDSLRPQSTFIVVPDKTLGMENKSASLLHEWLNKIYTTDSGFQIVKESGLKNTGGNILMEIGNTKANVSENLDNEPYASFVIKRTNEIVCIKGQNDLGTLMGTIYFLDHICGVRFYLPGDVFTSLPEHKTVMLDKEISVSSVPFTKYVFCTGFRAGDESNWAQNNGLLRKNFGSEEHTMGDRFYDDSIFALFPEIFPIIDGQKYFPKSAQDQNWEPDFAEPKLVDAAVYAAIKYFKKNPQYDYISFSVMDSKVYPNGGKMGDFLKNYPNDEQGKTRGYTDAFVAFINNLAERLETELPANGITNPKNVIYLVYGYVSMVPLVPLRPTVLPVTVSQIACLLTGTYFNDNGVLNQWSKMTNRIGNHDWGEGMGFIYPRIYTNLIPRYLQTIQKDSMNFEFGDVEMYPNWALDGPKNYFMSKIYWDPTVNIDSLLTLFCDDMFGISGSQMKNYFSTLEDLNTSMNNNPARLRGIMAYTTQLPLSDQELLLVSRARQYIDDALSIAQTNDQKTRIEFFSKGFKISEDLFEFYNTCEDKAVALKSYLKDTVAGDRMMLYIAQDSDFLKNMYSLIDGITTAHAPVAGTISGSSTVCPGTLTTFTSNGNSGGTWSSLTPSVATVNAASGVVTGITGGNATITYRVTDSCGRKDTASKVLTVIALNAGTVSGPAAVCVSATATYSTTSTNAGSWTSSKTGVATINPSTGVVTTVAAGTTTITFNVSNNCGTSAASATITVNPPASAGTISGSATLCSGTITTLASNGNSGGIWRSLTPSVATVDAISGVVTGVATGNSTITYTVTNNCGTSTISKLVTVLPLPVAGTVTGASTLCPLATTTFTNSGTGGGTWTSNNTAVASVNPSTGVVTGGKSSGTAIIQYTVTNNCGTSGASASINVNLLPVAGTITGASNICAGSLTTFTSNGISGGTWSSLTSSVATVDPASGVVTGVAAGNSTISYTVANSCGRTATTSKVITVNALLNAGVVSGASTVCTGSTTTYSTSSTFTGSWTSSKPSGATVNSTTGVVTGVAAGTATIKYTVSNSCGVSIASADITVNPLPNAGIINGSATVCARALTTYTSNGNVGGNWSSLTPSVATVSATTGVVTGVIPGSSMITYTATNGCGTAAVSKLITVNGAPTVSATNISVNTSLNNCSASPAFGSNVTVTGSPAPTLVYKNGTLIITSPHAFPFGSSTVTVSATNSCSIATATFLVSVTDNQSPIITCKPNATRTTSTSAYPISGSEFNASAADNCGTPSLIYSLSGATTAAFNAANTSLAGKLLNAGTTTITWRATDASDNVSNCTTRVTVSNTGLSLTKSDSRVMAPVIPSFTMKVMPNPTTTHFTLQFNSMSREKLKMTVADITGRLIEQKPDIPAKSTIEFGNKYHPGVYIAEILQGKNKVVFRLVKEGN